MCKQACSYVFVQGNYIKECLLVFSPFSAHFTPPPSPLYHNGKGSIGLLQDPGRIWPGKRMPGRMGGKTVTMKSLKVSTPCPEVGSSPSQKRLAHLVQMLVSPAHIPGRSNEMARFVILCQIRQLHTEEWHSVCQCSHLHLYIHVSYTSYTNLRAVASISKGP